MAELILNSYRYRILKPLGTPGFIAQAYLAEALDFEAQVVIKSISELARSPQIAIEQLRDEARVLRELNAAEVANWRNMHDAQARAVLARETVQQRHIIAGLDDGQPAYADWQYCVIQELAPGAIEPFPITDLAAELRALTLAHRLAKAVDTAHSVNIALKDFVPDSKIDRLHARWNDQGELVNFKLIDWNISGNQADFPNDRIFLNALIFALLTNYFPPLSEKVLSETDRRYDFAPFDPAQLGGIAWQRLSPPTQILLKRLIHPLPTARPATAAATAHEIQWLTDNVLREQDDIAPADWVDRAYAARETPHRVLMLVAAARQKIPTSYFLDDLSRLENEARQALIANEERMARDIEDELQYGVFRKAQRLLEETLPKITHEPIARRLRYRQQQTAFALAQLDRGVSPLGTPEYKTLDKVIQAMLAEDWQTAAALLQEGFADDPAVQALRAVVEWQSNRQSFDVQILAQRGFRAGEDKSIETQRLNLLHSLLAKLEQLAYQGAHVEPALGVQAARLRQEIQDRKGFLEFLYVSAPSYLDSEKEDIVRETAQQRLRREPDDQRAAMLLHEADTNANVRKQVDEIQAALERGDYQTAADRVRGLQKPPELLPAAWERISTRFPVETLKEQAQKSNQALEAAQSAMENLRREMSAVLIATDSGTLALTAAEHAALSTWEKIVQRTTEWLEKHEQRAPLLPENLVGSFRRLQDTAVQSCAAFLEQRLQRLATALDAFTPDIETDAGKLFGVLKEFSIAQTLDIYDRVHKRFESLRQWLNDTRMALPQEDLAQTLEVFDKLAFSPVVSDDQRNAVKSLLDAWRGIENIEQFQELSISGTPWPGLDRLRTRMQENLAQRLLTLAQTANNEEDWQRAANCYVLTTRYTPSLLEPHQTSYQQVQNYNHFVIALNQKLGGLNREKLESAQHAVAAKEELPSEVREQLNTEIEELRNAWKYWLEPLHNTKKYIQLSQQLEAALEARLWVLLPANPQGEDFDALRKLLGEIYIFTRLPKWQQTANLCADAKRYLDSGEFNIQTIVESKLPLLRKLQAESVPLRLRAWTSDQHKALEQGARKKIEDAIQKAETELHEERPDTALPAIQTVAPWFACLRNSPESQALQERYNTLQNQASELAQKQQELKKRWQAITNGNSTSTPDLPVTHTTLPDAALDDHLNVMDVKNKALQLPAVLENAFIARMITLQAALERKPKPLPVGIAEDARWAEFQQTLDDQLRDQLKTLRQQLREATKTELASLKEQLARGKAPSQGLAAKTALLLWQYAWYCEFDPAAKESFKLEPSLGKSADPETKVLPGAAATQELLSNQPADSSMTQETWVRIFVETMRAQCPEIPANLADELNLWCHWIADTIHYHRAQLVIHCDSGPKHQEISEKLQPLQVLLEALNTRPMNVEFPSPASQSWRPKVLSIFEPLTTSGKDLVGKWKDLRAPLSFESLSAAHTALEERKLCFDDIIKALALKYLTLWKDTPQDSDPKALYAELQRTIENLDERKHLASELRQAQLTAAYLAGPFYKTATQVTAALQAIKDAIKAQHTIHRFINEKVKDTWPEVSQLPLVLNEDVDVQWVLDEALQSSWQAHHRELQRNFLSRLALAVHGEYVTSKSPGRIDAIVAWINKDHKICKRVLDKTLVVATAYKPLDVDAILKDALR